MKISKTTLMLIGFLLAVAVLIGVLIFSISQREKEKTLDETLAEIMDKADGSKYADLRFEWQTDEDVARQRGDTYCKKCGRITEGKVRICSYCGKYVD